MNAEPLLLACLQHGLGVARRDRVAVLHGHDRHDLLRLLEVLDAHVGQPDVADLALVAQLGQRAHRLLERHLRVGRVQLVEGDRVQLQAQQRLLAAALQPLGPAVGLPAPGARAREAALGRDHEVGRIRVQGLGDQPLARLGAVGVRGVDEVHVELHDAAQQRDRAVAILRLSPDARAGDPHRAEAQPAHGHVAAERQLARGGGGRSVR